MILKKFSAFAQCGSAAFWMVNVCAILGEIGVTFFVGKWLHSLFLRKVHNNQFFSHKSIFSTLHFIDKLFRFNLASNLLKETLGGPVETLGSTRMYAPLLELPLDYWALVVEWSR
jgi:hypothetical protein